jgi:hypothetical protein
MQVKHKYNGLMLDVFHEVFNWLRTRFCHITCHFHVTLLCHFVTQVKHKFNGLMLDVFREVFNWLPLAFVLNLFLTMQVRHKCE